jgi:hypothetical protein
MLLHGADWIRLAQDKTQLRAVVNTLMKIEFRIMRNMPLLAEKLLALQEGLCSISSFTYLLFNSQPSLMCTSCPSYSPSFQYHNYIWWSSSFCIFLYSTFTFSRLRTHILPAPDFQTFLCYVLPLWWKSMIHFHTKQQVYIWHWNMLFSIKYNSLLYRFN